MGDPPVSSPLGPSPVAPGDPSAIGRARAPSDWAPWTALTGLFTLVGATLLVGALVTGVAAIAGADLKNPPAGFDIGASAIQEATMAAVAFAFAARLAGVASPVLLGFRRPRWRRAVAQMALTWFVFLTFTVVWVSALNINERQDIPDQLGADESTLALVGAAILVTVLAPICEEVFFRGFFFRALRNWRGPWVAAAITGLLFGAVHAFGSPIGFLVPLAVFGFCLSLLYWRTGSLLPCIALHALNNSLALGVAQGWDWQVPLLMAGALAVNAAIVLPLMRAGRRVPATA